MNSRRINIMTLSVILSFTANSAGLSKPYIPNLKVEETKILETDTGESKTTYKVDGIEIKLSKKDKVRARNWNLKNSDWAKYKYALEYTPRGTWTPNLDPPIVLGNLAKSETERRYYANIMNKIEVDRREREVGFQLSANALIFQANPMLNPDRVEPKTGIGKQLPEQLDRLRSIFLDVSDCNANCKRFITLAIATTSSRTKLDIHATGGSADSVRSLLNSIGVSQETIERKHISVSAKRRNDKVFEFQNGGSIPYYVNRTDEGSSRIHID